MDNILLASEANILEMSEVYKTTLMYVRMVDDISAVMCGPFSNVLDIIRIMGNKYPKLVTIIVDF